MFSGSTTTEQKRREAKKEKGRGRRGKRGKRKWAGSESEEKGGEGRAGAEVVARLGREALEL